MTRTDVAKLAFRLAAVYVWLNAVLFACDALAFELRANQSAPSAAPFPGLTPILTGEAVSFVFLAVLGLVLFARAGTLAQTMFPGDAPSQSNTPVSIAAIALRVFAIVLFARALTRGASLPWALDSARHDPQYVWSLAADAATLSLLVGGGACLFLAALPIARRFFGYEPSAGETTHSRTQAVVFSVVGLWLLMDALPTVVSAIVGLIGRWSGEGSEYNFIASDIRREWPEILRAILGVLLFLGGAGVAAFWSKTQEAGRRAQRAGLEPNKVEQ